MNPIQNDVSEAPEGADQAPVDDDMPGAGVDDLHSTSDEDAHARAQDAEGGEHTQTTFQSTTLIAVFKRDITRTEMSTGDLAAAATLAQVAISTTISEEVKASARALRAGAQGVNSGLITFDYPDELVDNAAATLWSI